MKKVYLSVLSAIIALFFTTTASAATGEGGVKLLTDTNYYGIQGYFTVPSDVFVSNDGGYIAFYLGLGDVCEGGISYTPSEKWKKFLNCGKQNPASNKSMPLASQPAAGEQIHIKLVNNLNDTASLYINGVESYTLPVQNSGSLKAPTKVKMVHTTQDNQDKNRYKNAAFNNVQVQTSKGGPYTTFPTNIAPTFPFPSGKGDYEVIRSNPLATTLKAGK
ncbi:hypothetical protein [Paenibacillus elgii]|uniref:hypothetical protein n=1 Tax=Paenibacillus elgii TaxID=189691 RepID=UPI000FD7558B|nr:hypothetical protein [Paenibacillus elgii]NEN86921.1 hypothetical protein [Paenibacillus elgii]